LHVHVPGAVIERGSIDQLADDALVIVPATSSAAARLGTIARAHPSSHFALIGGSARSLRLPNVVGLVIREDQAALLAGVVAGLSAAEEGVAQPRVAWIGPQDRPLIAAYARGVHIVNSTALVLHAPAPNERTQCKEAALGAIIRGAVAVVAHQSPCAGAVVAGAHQQNMVAMRLSDFELPEIIATATVQDAVAGVYHGHEDLVFDAKAGAVGITRLDPRISATVAVRARVAAQQLASGQRPSG